MSDELERLNRDNARLSNMVDDYGRKLDEWRELTGCECPTAAKRELSRLRLGRAELQEALLTTYRAEWGDASGPVCEVARKLLHDKSSELERLRAGLGRTRPLGWTAKLTTLVGHCIREQRNGTDVLASTWWNSVVEHWTEAEKGRD